MKKLLSSILCLVLALSLGLACSCSAPDSPNPPSDNPSTPPVTNSGISENQWENILDNSSIDNVTVLEGITTPSQTAVENTEYSIDGNRIHIIYSGVRHEDVTDSNKVENHKKLHGFYQSIEFDNMSYNNEKDSYSVSGEIVITIDDNIYKFTDIIVKINTKIYVIEKITATRTLGSEVKFVSNTYTQFGSTSAS